MKYISANEYLTDSWRLAAAVRESGWRPDIIIALWRGGAPVGIAVHEFFKATGWDVAHVPLKCASYSGIDKSSDTVVFTHGDPVFAAIRPGQRVLVVDDVYDTGRTAKAVSRRLASIGAEMRFACVYLKSSRVATDATLDYFVTDLGDEWIVFPHEIDGLSRDQIAEKDPALASLLAPYDKTP